MIEEMLAPAKEMVRTLKVDLFLSCHVNAATVLYLHHNQEQSVRSMYVHDSFSEGSRSQRNGDGA